MNIYCQKANRKPAKPSVSVKLLTIALLLALCPIWTKAQTFKMGQSDGVGSERWVRQMFMGRELPFSFELDGRSSREFLSQWKRELSRPEAQSDGRIKYQLRLLSPKAQGLEIVCDITCFNDFGAVEWTLNFKNTGQQNSGQLSHVLPLDAKFAGNVASTSTLYSAQGCNAIDRDFHLIQRPIVKDSTLRYEPYGGRPSSLSGFPFFNVANDDGKGVFFSIGWTGSWMAEFKGLGSGLLHMSSGMPNTDLFLYPGEKVRTPLVSLLFWQGQDRIDGHNSFRRFVLKHHSPKANGKPLNPPLCAGFDYGDPAPCDEYEAITPLLAAACIERHQRFGVTPEIYWLDAGWFEGCDAPNSAFEGRSWWTTVGNWVADPNRFPKGLKEIADEVHRHGAEFMVWFEPERVYDSTRWHREHPEWMLSLPNSKHHLLNLGNEQALNWLCQYMGDFFEQNGIDHYRQDFNINPASFWAAADSAGRHGITEIRYVEGLYRYWDYLHKRFPKMLIDNCASGGRRLDLETISRSIPLWRTDCHYGEPTCQQCHSYGLHQFLPLHGTGIYYADRYSSRSGLSSAYAWFGEIFSRRNAVADMRHLFKTYKELRQYYLKDYYPLSGDGDQTGLKRWVAWQFHDPQTNSGIIQAFRRDESSEGQQTYRLRGLDPKQTYAIYNEDNQITVQRTGAELMEGVPLFLPEARSSLLLRYKVQDS